MLQGIMTHPAFQFIPDASISVFGKVYWFREVKKKIPTLKCLQMPQASKNLKFLTASYSLECQTQRKFKENLRLVLQLMIRECS
jgi:hypothetical protein